MEVKKNPKADLTRKTSLFFSIALLITMSIVLTVFEWKQQYETAIRDGSITDIKLVKGIGAGCDEEAIRVIQNSPKWNPGKQRGKPVRQKMVLPIIFKLG
jgi:hypothetical protein